MGDDEDFDPVALIRAVNELRALGKEEALDALTLYVNYCREHEDDAPARGLSEYRILPICRVLFVGSGGEERMPQLRLGQPQVFPAGIDLDDWPKYPIVMAGDLPLTCESRYALGGVAGDVMDQIAFCRIYCELRSSPLTPTDTPTGGEEALEVRLLGTDSNGYPSENTDVRQLLRRQARNALRVLPGLDSITDPFTEKDWQHLKDLEAHYEVKWSAESQSYTYTAK
jgi:hypothetical protein